MVFGNFSPKVVDNAINSEGEKEWLRTTAWTAAVVDMSRSRWTWTVSLTASRLFACNVPPAGAVAGSAQFHLQPPADRTAGGACETFGTGSSYFPSYSWRPGPYVCNGPSPSFLEL